MNIAVIGCVSVGKSSFINSFVQTPVASVALKRETFTPTRYVFDPKYPRSFVRSGEPSLKIVERKVYGRTICESLTDYPGLDDNSDNRDILGVLIENLKLYHVVIFVVDAQSPFVSKSENEIFAKLEKGVADAYARGVPVHLKIVVAKYDADDSEIVDIVSSNMSGKQYFRWNAYNSMRMFPEEFQVAYGNEWKKIARINGGTAYDWDNLRGFLTNYNREGEKKICLTAYHNACDSWDRLPRAVAYLDNYDRLREWMANQNSCPLERGEIREAILRTGFNANSFIRNYANWCTPEFIEFLRAHRRFPRASMPNIDVKICLKYLDVPAVYFFLWAHVSEDLKAITVEKVCGWLPVLIALGKKDIVAWHIDKNFKQYAVHREIVLAFPEIYKHPELYTEAPVTVTSEELVRYIENDCLLIDAPKPSFESLRESFDPNAKRVSIATNEDSVRKLMSTLQSNALCSVCAIYTVSYEFFQYPNMPPICHNCRNTLYGCYFIGDFYEYSFDTSWSKQPPKCSGYDCVNGWNSRCMQPTYFYGIFDKMVCENCIGKWPDSVEIYDELYAELIQGKGVPLKKKYTSAHGLNVIVPDKCKKTAYSYKDELEKHGYLLCANNIEYLVCKHSLDKYGEYSRCYRCNSPTKMVYTSGGPFRCRVCSVGEKITPQTTDLKTIKRLSEDVRVLRAFTKKYPVALTDLQREFPNTWFLLDFSNNKQMAPIIAFGALKGWEVLYLSCGGNLLGPEKEKIYRGVKCTPELAQWCHYNGEEFCTLDKIHKFLKFD